MSYTALWDSNSIRLKPLFFCLLWFVMSAPEGHSLALLYKENSPYTIPYLQYFYLPGEKIRRIRISFHSLLT
jgi:hypothetical protein